jgi:hypothetical protein
MAFHSKNKDSVEQLTERCHTTRIELLYQCEGSIQLSKTSIWVRWPPPDGSAHASNRALGRKGPRDVLHPRENKRPPTRGGLTDRA